MTRKILYSPGYGAGWVSWNSSPVEMASYLLTYQPIIDFIEKGGDTSQGTFSDILDELIAYCKETWDQNVYPGGACKLRVAEVSGRVKIDEYDGYESYTEEGNFSGWL